MHFPLGSIDSKCVITNRSQVINIHEVLVLIIQFTLNVLSVLIECISEHYVFLEARSNIAL